MGTSLPLGETGGFWISLFLVGEPGGLSETSLSVTALFTVLQLLNLGDCVSSLWVFRFVVS